MKHKYNIEENGNTQVIHLVESNFEHGLDYILGEIEHFYLHYSYHFPW